MSEELKNESYLHAQEGFRKIKEILVEMSKTDLSKIHIGHEWSWVPYVKDHLDFLIEQVEGLAENLLDAPVPTKIEDLEAIGKK